MKARLLSVAPAQRTRARLRSAQVISSTLLVHVKWMDGADASAYTAEKSTSLSTREPMKPLHLLLLPAAGRLLQLHTILPTASRHSQSRIQVFQG